MAKTTDQAFESIRIVGGLLSSKVLQDARRYQLPGQSKEDYSIEPGLTFNEEIGRYWRIAQGRWQEFQQQSERQDISSHKIAQNEWLLPLLTRVMGYDIAPSPRKQIGEREFPITHMANNGTVPMVLCGANYDLDKGDPLFGQEGRKRSPMGLAQEYLNAETGCLWSIVSNGRYLRLLRDNPAMTRPAYIEIDFTKLFEEDNYADFATTWLLLQATRLSPRNGQIEQCWLEQWRDKGHDEGERALDKLRYGVADALRELGTGFVANKNNQVLRDKLSKGELTTDEYFQQVLRLVYRFLFLITAEDRDVALLPKDYDGQDFTTPRKLYEEGYSITKLRERARLNRHYDTHGDAWQQLLITFAGYAKGQPLLAQPALGGLFAADQCPVLETSALENRYLYRALFNLSYFEHNQTLSRINYRDMDTEEFGSVYESLLELIPQLSTEGRWQFSFIGDARDETAASGHSRKLTGSYYTPDSLVQELIKSALEPVIADRLKSNPQQPREAVLSITVCDPACGSGHFLLAAARRLASELAGIDAGTDQPTEQHYRHAIRDVVRNCIYGVDLNPMAVELCKTGLWLESIEPGKPLSFLDAHIQNGNALVGILDHRLLEQGIPGDAYNALTGDDKATCAALKKQNAAALKKTKAGDKLAISLRQIPQQLAAVECMPEDTVDQVDAKRRAFNSALSDTNYQKQRLKEDLFTAAFYAIKTTETADRVPTSAHLILLADGQPLPVAMLDSIKSLATEHRFFHWPLAFPHVFGGLGKGGFDVMLGNPPWDQLQYDPQEFFASRAPDIANAQHMSARLKKIDALEKSSPHLYNEHLKSQRAILSTQGFVHGSGRYPLTSFGRINLAPLFAELFSNAQSPSGLSGFIVPSGIATDSFTQVFFRSLAEGSRIRSLYDFENRDKLFKSVDSRLKFCLLTLGCQVSQSQFGFFLSQPQQILDRRKIFSLTGQDFALLNPNTRTCPVFRSNKDSEITKKIYSNSQVLIRESTENSPEINPWGVSFQLMFMMNTSSHLFLTLKEIEKNNSSFNDSNAKARDQGLMPLLEGKMVHQYDHRWATYESDSEASRDCTLEEKQNPNYQNLPRYWVPEQEVTLRTAKAPKLVLNAAKDQDETALTKALKLWLAGYLIEKQGVNSGQDLIGRIFGESVYQSGHDLFGGGLTPLGQQAQNIHQEYQLTDEEADQLITNIENEVWPFLWSLLEARRPKYLLGWRDICRATDERTVIAGVIPLCGVGNNLPLLFNDTSIHPTLLACLLGNLLSLPFDFVARHKVGGTHLNFFIIKQLPVLDPNHFGQTDIDFIVSRILELVYTAYDLKPFAEDLGYDCDPFPFNPERRQILKCELDAYYAKLYGLTRDELRYILDPADIMGEDYPSESFRVLKDKELRQFGEYRTQRLVLEAWDKFVEGKK